MNRQARAFLEGVEHERRMRYLYDLGRPAIDLGEKAGTLQYTVAVLSRLEEGPATRAECEDAARGLLVGRDSGLVRDIVWDRLAGLGEVVGPTNERPEGGLGRPRAVYRLGELYGERLLPNLLEALKEREAREASRGNRRNSLPDVKGGVVFDVVDEDDPDKARRINERRRSRGKWWGANKEAGN